MKRLVVGVLAPAVLGTALLLGGCASSTTPELGKTAPPSITTRGVGTVRGTPDTLGVELGVTTRGASAADALTDNSTRTSGLLDVLRGRGVAPADLRTSGLAIGPTYGQNGEITGYEVTNTVTATLRDLAGAGALIDAAAQAAGDAVRVARIGFDIDDDAAPRAQARADAVRQAVTQARQLADAADVTLGPVLSITEVTDGRPPTPVAQDGAGRAAAQAVPIEPGTQDVTVTVEVVHAVGS